MNPDIFNQPETPKETPTQTNWNAVLLEATKNSDFFAFDKALANGANVNCWENTDKFNNCTPLHYAAQNGRLSMVRTLVERGADKNAELTMAGDIYGGASSRAYTPLQLAALSRHADIVAFLTGDQTVVNNDMETTIGNRQPQHISTHELEESIRRDKLGLEGFTRV